MRFIYLPEHLRERGGHFLQKLIVPLVLVSPIMTLPQVIEVWGTGKVEGVSIYTWGGYALGTFFWAVYGFKHKEMLLMWVNIILFVMDIMIALGVYLHTL